MLASLTHIVPLTSLRRARILPVKGKVLARVGQVVTANDIVAEAFLRRKHIMLDMFSVFNTSSSSQVKRLIERKIGDKVQEGDIIARSGGLFSKEMLAPVDGTIVSFTGGQVLLEVKSPPFRLRSGIPGEVVEIIPDRGVIIESSGLLIQGVWGNNRINSGKLTVLSENPELELSRQLLKSDLRGAVVMSAYCTQQAVLKETKDCGLQGLILGGIPAELIPTARNLDFPVILLDGIGSPRINTVAYKLLSTNEGREVSINAVPWDISTGDRPELVIKLPSSGEVVTETDIFKAGQTVRIQVFPYIGIIGKIDRILPGLTVLPNGLRVPAASVILETKEQLPVPFANMSVIE